MALERSVSPLPRGRYWQDVFEPKWPVLDQWLAASGGRVVVLAQERHRAPVLSGQNDRRWLLFEVVEPLDWPAVELGYPTRAAPQVRDSGDTVKRPVVLPPEAHVDRVGRWLKVGAWMAGGFLVVRALELRR